jgi:transposase
MRKVVNAIRYLETTGCSWRGLPESFPNRSTVWHYFSKWRRHDLWATLSQILQRLQDAGDDPGPTKPQPHSAESVPTPNE